MTVTSCMDKEIFESRKKKILQFRKQMTFIDARNNHQWLKI